MGIRVGQVGGGWVPPPPIIAMGGVCSLGEGCCPEGLAPAPCYWGGSERRKFRATHEPDPCTFSLYIPPLARLLGPGGAQLTHIWCSGTPSTPAWQGPGRTCFSQSSCQPRPSPSPGNGSGGSHESHGLVDPTLHPGKGRACRGVGDRTPGWEWTPPPPSPAVCET